MAMLLLPAPSHPHLPCSAKSWDRPLLTCWLMTSASSSSKATSLRIRASFSVSGGPWSSAGQKPVWLKALAPPPPSFSSPNPSALTRAGRGSQLLLNQLFQSLGHQSIEIWCRWAWGEQSQRWSLQDVGSLGALFAKVSKWGRLKAGSTFGRWSNGKNAGSASVRSPVQPLAENALVLSLLCCCHHM